MLSSSERLLIVRYLWPGIGGRLILLVGAIGCMGVAISVASLVLVVSVMNASEAKLARQISRIDGDIAVSRRGGRIGDWRSVRTVVAATPGVGAATPTLIVPAMLTVEGRMAAADLQGLDPIDMALDAAFAGAEGYAAGVAPTGDGLVSVGSDLARRQGVLLGSQVAVSLVTASAVEAIGMRTIGLQVSRIVATGHPAYDGRRMVLPLRSLQRLTDGGDVVNRIAVLVKDKRAIDSVASALRERLGGQAIVLTLREMNASVFAALATERVMMSTVMSIVTVIAMFNILSSMVMLARFKAREIAILRTMGMSTGAVARVFVGTGTAIGVLGGAVGLATGMVLIASKDRIVEGVRTLFAVDSIETRILLDLPLQISGTEIARIMAAVLAGAVLSTLYPALRAARTAPASVLRYE